MLTIDGMFSQVNQKWFTYDKNVRMELLDKISRVATRKNSIAQTKTLVSVELVYEVLKCYWSNFNAIEVCRN